MSRVQIYDRLSRLFEKMRKEEGLGDEVFISEGHDAHDRIIYWAYKQIEKYREALEDIAKGHHLDTCSYALSNEYKCDCYLATTEKALKALEDGDGDSQ